MTPSIFPEQNFTFVKPNKMTDDECAPLSVYRGPHPDGSGQFVVIAKWADPATGKSVFITIYGMGIPPMYLGAENPFADGNKITSAQKAAYIISMYHFAPNQNQLEWIGMISEGQRDIKSSKAGSGRTLFNKVFIEPWNTLFKDDVITFIEE